MYILNKFVIYESIEDIKFSDGFLDNLMICKLICRIILMDYPPLPLTSPATSPLPPPFNLVPRPPFSSPP